MKKLVIIGASGFGREVAWLIERINKKEPTWDLIGFIDDDPRIQNTEINGYNVLGTIDKVIDFADSYFVCAIGSSITRKKIIEKIDSLINAHYATIVDPSVEISKYTKLGEGVIICAHSIITVNVEIGNHVIINLDCTIGHDAIINDFVTLYPNANVSGCTNIGKCVEMGTGMKIIQNISICPYSICGAGSIVVKNIYEAGTYVGCPAKKIK